MEDKPDLVSRCEGSKPADFDKIGAVGVDGGGGAGKATLVLFVTAGLVPTPLDIGIVERVT